MLKSNMAISLKLISNRIKKPLWSKENILAIYSPKKYVIREADTTTVDTEIIINLPTKSTAYVATKFKGQKIKEIRGPQKERVRITLLNESYFQKHMINKERLSDIYYHQIRNSASMRNKKKSTTKYRKTTYRKRGSGKKFGKKSNRQEASWATMTLPIRAETQWIKLVK